eukprot:381180-Pyramimonas_sp.AAC.1
MQSVDFRREPLSASMKGQQAIRRDESDVQRVGERFGVTRDKLTALGNARARAPASSQRRRLTTNVALAGLSHHIPLLRAQNNRPQIVQNNWEENRNFQWQSGVVSA